MSAYCAKIFEALSRLRAEARGVVSFEYVVVAACMIGVAGAVFGTSTGAGVAGALTTIVNSIVDAVKAVVL